MPVRPVVWILVTAVTMVTVVTVVTIVSIVSIASIVSIVSIVPVVMPMTSMMSMMIMCGVRQLHTRMRQPAAARCGDALLHKLCRDVPAVLECKRASINAQVVVAVRNPRFPQSRRFFMMVLGNPAVGSRGGVRHIECLLT